MERKQFLIRSSSQLLKSIAGVNGIQPPAESSDTIQPTEKKKAFDTDNIGKMLNNLDLHKLTQKITTISSNTPPDPFSPYISTLPKYLYNIKIVNLESHAPNDIIITSSYTINDSTNPSSSPAAVGTNNNANNSHNKYIYNDGGRLGLSSSMGHNPFIPETYAKSISTYPHFTGNDKPEGHPICDAYCIRASRAGALCVIADGCGWGERSKAAAEHAAQALTDYVSTRIGKLRDVRSAAELLLKGFNAAHSGVLQHTHSPNDNNAQCIECTKCGTTTLLAGLIVPIESHPITDEKHTHPRWGFVCCSIGDCKAFAINGRKISEVTIGSRHSAADATDCGGRLGPQMEGECIGAPDLRNLSLFFHPIREGDVLLLVSDGVHDNFDPEHLGKTPRDLGLKFDTWDAVDAADANDVKDIFRNRMLEDMVQGARELDEIVDRLLMHSRVTTAASRFWMEQHRARLPKDYVKFPGKMDHTTCVAVKVPLQTYTV